MPGTSVNAGTNVIAQGYINAGTTMYAPTSMQSAVGLFTNILRTGGGTATGSYTAAICGGQRTLTMQRRSGWVHGFILLFRCNRAE